MSTSVSWPAIGGTSYSIPAAGEVNWQSLSNFLIALGNNAQSTANTKLAIRVALSSPVTVSSTTDCVVVTDLTVAGAITVNLPAGVTGQVFFVTDGKGDAATNNIMIDPSGAETINGSATYVINKNRAGVLFGFNGTGWTVLSEFTNIAAGTIPRSSIAAGTANAVVINDGSGNLSSEAQLAKSRGGTGADNSSVTFPATGTVTTDAGTTSLTNKTIDGDLNTLQDIPVTAMKTVIGQANRFLSYDGAGAPIATKVVPTGTVIGTTDTQVLTNKDIDGGTASNTSRFTVPSNTFANLVALTRKAGTIVYGTDTQLEYYDDGTQLRPIGSGSGSGKNYVKNPNDANANWTASGAGVTVTTETTTSNIPDNLTQTTGVKILRSSGTTVYAYTRFTLDQADYNKKLALVWDQAFAGAAGDFTIAVYSNTASNYGGTSTLLTLATSSVANGTFSFNTTFDSPGSAAPYLELRIIAAAGTSPLYLNNVTVTPGQIVQGAAVSNAVTFTPVVGAGFGTATNAFGWYVRNGNIMRGLIQFKAGTLTTSAPVVTIPGGFSSDSTLYVVGRTRYGIYNISATGGTGIFNTADISGLVIPSATPTEIRFAKFNDSDGSGNVYQTNGNTTTMMQNNGNVAFDFEIPIAEWSGNGTVNLGQGAQVQLFSSTTGTWDATAAAGNTVAGLSPIPGALTADRAKVVRLPYAPQSISDVKLVFVPTGYTAPVGQESWAPWVGQAAANFGARITALSGTDVTITFYNFKAQGSTFNSTTGGVNWASSDAQWGLMVANPSAPVGFGLASGTVSGLVTLPTSEVRLSTGNGYGSTNTKIRRFTNALVNTGSAITYADSATLGGSFTINIAGVYSIYYSDNGSAGACDIGISVNSSQLTTSIASITDANCLAIGNTPAAGLTGVVAVTARLAAGDVIRAHVGSVTPNGTVTYVRFDITQVAST